MENYFSANKPLTITLNFANLDKTKCVQLSVSNCVIAQTLNNQMEFLHEFFNNIVDYVKVSPLLHSIYIYFKDNTYTRFRMTPELVEIARNFDKVGFDETLTQITCTLEEFA